MPTKSNYEPNRKKKYTIILERLFPFVPRAFVGKPCAIHRTIAVYALSLAVFLGVLTSLSAPSPVVASPGVHINVPHSPLSLNQPVYIEYYTDPGEDGTIQLDITKPPLLAIFWQSGPMPISGGLLYDITIPGFNDPGTYIVSASVSLAGGTIYGSTPFEVVGGGQPGQPGGPGFDFHMEVFPPETEVERGGTARYEIIIQYSDPSFSGTMVNVDVMGLGPGMHWHMEPGGQLFITTAPETPPGHYMFEIIGEAQGVVRQVNAVLIVREGPEEHPEEPPPEEHPPEETPEQHPEEHPPEETPEQHPEEHPEEPPPEEHPPEQHPEDQPEEYRPYEPGPQEGAQQESAATSLLENPLYLIVIALIVIIILLVIALMRKSS